MVTLRKILKGEDITVKYDRDGYYGKDCKCSTCQGVSTRNLVPPAKQLTHTAPVADSGNAKKRKGHRGGKTGRAEKAKRARTAEDEDKSDPNE